MFNKNYWKKDKGIKYKFQDSAYSYGEAQNGIKE